MSTKETEYDTEVINYKRLENRLLIKKIWPFLKPYKGQLILVLSTLPILAVLNATQPYLFKLAIDQYNNSKSVAEFNPILIPIILGVIAIVSTLMQIAQNYIIQGVGQRFVAKIRSSMFKHMQGLSIDFFEKNSTGKLLTRLTNDLEALSETLSSGLIGASNDLFNILGLAGFMLWLNPKLSLAIFLLMPILILIMRGAQSLYRHSTNQARIYLSQLNSIFQESMWGILVIKLFNAKELLSEHYNEINQKYIRANNTYIAIDSSFSALIELIGIFGIIIVLVTSLRLGSEITAGELIAFIGYTQMLFQPVQSLSEKFGIFQNSFTSIEKIVEILEQKTSMREDQAQKDKELPTIQELNISSLSFRYNPDSALVLKDINLKLKKGKSLGIVGRTGSGKSTLIKLLTRFYDPVKGQILINNNLSLVEINPFIWRQKVLLIPQRSFLFSGSVRENLSLDQDISDQELEKICQQTGLSEIITKMPNGLDTELRQGGVDLSNGEKQLIALTRAIAQDPEILILDEATADLDSYTESLIAKATKEIICSGKTVIFIAHRMNLVAECDQILILSGGEIIESGTHQELISHEGHYHYLYQLSDLI